VDETKGQRKFSRVDFRITAAVQCGGRLLNGTVENLSLRGMLMAADQKLAVGDAAEITIDLVGPPQGAADLSEEPPLIQIDGRVVRVTDTGLAFSFERMDSDSYIHLKRIITLNSGDAMRADEEMQAFLGGTGGGRLP